MKRWIRRIVLAVVALVAIAAAVWAAWPRPVRVETARVSRGALRITVEGEGKTRVKDRYVVSAPLAGELPRIGVHAGDEVEQGTILARITPGSAPLLDERTKAQALAKVKAAEAAKDLTDARVELTKTTLDFAQTDYARVKALVDKGAATQSDLDVVDLKLRTATKEHDSAVFSDKIAIYELELARAALTRTTAKGATDAGVELVRSPVRGRVLHVLQESAGVVAAGTPLVELGDPSAIEIVVDLLSTDAVKVSPGAPMDVIHWGGDVDLQAKVRLVGPAGYTKVSSLGIEEQRVDVVADFVGDAKAWSALGDGYRVEGRVLVEERPDVEKVPVGALFRHGEDWAVFVVASGRATLRVVQLGRRNDLEAEIVAGLRDGDVVILHPSDQVDEGVRVVGP